MSTAASGRTTRAALAGVASTHDALTLFDGLAAVQLGELVGRWTGSELPTGHPLDGLLSASGWYGKQFDGPDDVHPLLFTTTRGEVIPLDPRRLPTTLPLQSAPSWIIALGRRMIGPLAMLLRARKPGARLRTLEHRGVATAAMVYDDLPIIDVFRRIDEATVVGLMDRRGVPPYFFVLRRS